jgi:deoxyribonuclease-4
MNLGHHLGIGNNFVKSLDRVVNTNIDVIQIFIVSNISFNKCTIAKEKLLEFGKICHNPSSARSCDDSSHSKNDSIQTGIHPTTKVVGVLPDCRKNNSIKIFIHAPYVINLSNIEENNFNRCKSSILNHLDVANIIGAVGVIIHVGKATKLDPVIAVDNFVNSIKQIIKDYNGNSKLIIETAAGQGTEICVSMDELSSMYNRFSSEERDRLGICIDTCHIFAAGSDITTEDKILEYYEKISLLFNEDDIKCIHMNDSKCVFRSRKDRHADIGHGHIGLENLKYFYNLFKQRDIPFILETPTDNISYHEQIRNLII